MIETSKKNIVQLNDKGQSVFFADLLDIKNIGKEHLNIDGLSKEEIRVIHMFSSNKENIANLFRVAKIESICLSASKPAPEDRFIIGASYTRVLANNFPGLIEIVDGKSHDIIYDGKVRISIKSQTNIFERQSEKNLFKTLYSHSLQIKNVRGENREDKLRGFDMLLAIEAREILVGGDISVSFGLSTIDNVRRRLERNNLKDQITARFCNKDWNYYSGEFILEGETLAVQEQIKSVIENSESDMYSGISSIIHRAGKSR